MDDIAAKMDVSFQTIVRYMKLQVAEGALTVSDVFFGIRPARREVLEGLFIGAGARDTKQYYASAGRKGFSWDEANLYYSLRDSRISRGDMYEHVADVEVELHRRVRKVLEDEFGATDRSWWRKGVPLSVRKSCVQAREEDSDPVEEPYAYTTLINLAEIVDKNWGSFQGQLPEEWTANRKRLLSDLTRLNHIRNAVMHPVKEKRWTEADFAFVRGLAAQLRGTHATDLARDRPLQRTVRFAPRSRRP